MEIITDYLATLATPATVWQVSTGQYDLSYRQGKILLANYLQMLRQSSPKSLQFLRHSQNLYSCVMRQENRVIILGPVILNLNLPVENTSSFQTKTIFELPKLLKTTYLDAKQYLKQISFLAQLMQLPLKLAEIEKCFANAKISRIFDKKLQQLHIDNEGGHVSYLYERAVKKAIAQGNVAALPIIFKQNINSGRIGVLANHQDSLRSIKNWGIISVSVNLRALFDVGIDYELVYSLNDQYVRDIESLTSYNEVLAAIEAADVDMAMRCRELVNAKMTMPIKKVYWQVINNPTQSFEIGQLAKAVQLSPRYLGSQFKKQVGLSINQFWRLVQINQALEELMGTSISISELAEKYAFADQAHFSRTFREWTGVSPKQVRDNGTLLADWNLYDYLFSSDDLNMK